MKFDKFMAIMNDNQIKELKSYIPCPVCGHAWNPKDGRCNFTNNHPNVNNELENCPDC